MWAAVQPGNLFSGLSYKAKHLQPTPTNPSGGGLRKNQGGLTDRICVWIHSVTGDSLKEASLLFQRILKRKEKREEQLNKSLTVSMALVMVVCGTGFAISQPVNLGKAGTFVILTQTGITDVPTSAVKGNIGTSPITGAAILLTCAEDLETSPK
jgi:hypothetical protein